MIKNINLKTVRVILLSYLSLIAAVGSSWFFIDYITSTYIKYFLTTDDQLKVELSTVDFHIRSLIIILVILLLVIAATATRIRVLGRRVRGGKGSEIQLLEAKLKRTRGEYSKFIQASENLGKRVYSGEEISSRFDVIKKKITHRINSNGDTDAEVEYRIKCTKNNSHFFFMSMFTEDYGGCVEGFNELNIRIRSEELVNKKNIERNLRYLPIIDQQRSKRILIFFEEMKEADERVLRIHYSWPRYWGELLEVGTTMFKIENIKGSLQEEIDLEYTWIFDRDFPKVEIKRDDSPESSTNKFVEKTENGYSIINFKDEKSNGTETVMFELI